MGIENKTKLNNLLSSWPRGSVAVYPFFKQQKISHQLVAKYLKNNWIEKISDGAYKRFDDKTVEWYGGLYSIQAYLKLPVYVGGPKALEIHGYTQNLSPAGKSVVWLFGKYKTSLPRWFLKNNWGPVVRYQTIRLFNSKKEIGIIEREVNGLKLIVSSPERAILETLNFVPNELTFEFAQNAVESLQTLRPKIVEELLCACRSIKVKRLFLFLAQYNKLPWLKSINRNKIDLGKGFRSIANPGVLDKEHLITVPASFKTTYEK